MSGALKTAGSIAGKVAQPLIGMMPGGGMINSGIDIFQSLFGGGGGQQGGNPTMSIPMPYGGSNYGIQGQAPTGGGGGFDWTKLLGLLGGGAALYGANKTGMLDPLKGAIGGFVQPQTISDPRNDATNWFATMLQNGGNAGATLAGQGTLPGYQGPWAAGATPEQQAASGGMSQFFTNFMNGGQGTDIMSRLGQAAQPGQGMQLPPELMQALGGGQAGNQFLQGMAGGNDPISQMLMGQSGQQNPFMGQLGQSGQQDFTGGGQGMIGQAGSWLGQQMNNGTIQNLLKGGQSADIGQIASQLDAARRPGLNRDVRDLREQFSFNGLRNSTDLGGAVAARQAESESGMMGQLAQMMPQLLGQSSQTSLGTLNAISNLAGTQGQLGQMAGQLGLGQGGLLQSGLQGAGSLFGQGQNNQTNALSALLGNQSGAAQALNQGGNQQAQMLASLFGGQQGNQLQALLAQPGAFSMLNQLPGQMAQQLFGMGTQQQNTQQQGIQNQIGGFNQQQSMLPALLGFLSGTPQQQVAPSWLSQLGQLGIGAATVKQGK